MALLIFILFAHNPLQYAALTKQMEQAVAQYQQLKEEHEVLATHLCVEGNRKKAHLALFFFFFFFFKKKNCLKLRERKRSNEIEKERVRKKETDHI